MTNSTPLKAIRLKCLDCSCNSIKEVKLCVIPDCALYPYRFGKNPNIKRKKSSADHLRKHRLKPNPKIKS